MEVDVDEEEDVPSIDDLVAALADVGNNWERVPLKQSDGREGWEEALIGCLKDVRSFRFLRLVSLLIIDRLACDGPIFSEASSYSQ